MVYLFYSITVVGITASPSDYTFLSFTPSGSSTLFFSFTPIDDDRVENDEAVLATMSTTDPQAEMVITQVQIIIHDDDSMSYFSFITDCIRKKYAGCLAKFSSFASSNLSSL